jgi:hypothetical protein
MTFEELLPELDKLSRTEKFRAVQILVQQLATEEHAVIPEGDYHIWSPIEAFGAADALLAMLEERKKGSTDNG